MLHDWMLCTFLSRALRNFWRGSYASLSPKRSFFQRGALARLVVSRGPDRQQKKAESKFKGNREERRLELSFSCAASSVPLTPTNERAVIKGTLAVVCTRARRNKRDARHKAAPRTDRRADSCGTTRAFSWSNAIPKECTALSVNAVNSTACRTNLLSITDEAFFYSSYFLLHDRRMNVERRSHAHPERSYSRNLNFHVNPEYLIV